jgi:hypothetical protein
MKGLWPILLQSVLPAVLTFVVGLSLPWVRWSVEKRRKLLNYRMELIKTWRENIEAFDFESSKYGDTGWYGAMRQHMDTKKRRDLESGRVFYVPAEGRGDDWRKHVLLDEVARIEKKWGLV